ncbi:MAG: AIR synthase-related protein [Methanospirillum sp.]
MDVEEFVRRGLRTGEDRPRIEASLADHVRMIKAVDEDYAAAFARAAVDEALLTHDLPGDLFQTGAAGVGMGEFGVGSRGTGDFFAHRQIARIIGKTTADVGVDQMDDAGVVRVGDQYVCCTVDGMHSRLSDFPFLAGFHVTRATLRDVYVMGARPILLFSDIHVADDGDVAKIFEYTAGITAVGDSVGVPLVSGSTLRIGGDMVLGSRMTGCVGTVGVARHLTARRGLAPGDVLLMTEGAGGGTIATAALYSGHADVVDRTINLQFLYACRALIESPVLDSVHAMTDVTNGGLRGDAHEMAATANCRVVVEEEAVRPLVDEVVGAMLDELGIDPLGVSLDSLLIGAPPDAIPAIAEVVRGAGVRCAEVGRVEAGAPAAVLVTGGRETDFTPRFREAAYTPLKKVVDRRTGDIAAMQARVETAALAAIEKKERVKARLAARRG